MATKWGTFSEPGYLHPGVIYNKAYKAPKDTPLSGSFKPALGCTKTGKVCKSHGLYEGQQLSVSIVTTLSDCGCRPMTQPSASLHPFTLVTSLKTHRQGKAVSTLHVCLLSILTADCPLNPETYHPVRGKLSHSHQYILSQAHLQF